MTGGGDEKCIQKFCWKTQISCEHGNKPFIKDKEFLDQPSIYQLLMKHSCSMQLVTSSSSSCHLLDNGRTICSLAENPQFI
jgi:hypothetical protein